MPVVLTLSLAALILAGVTIDVAPGVLAQQPVRDEARTELRLLRGQVRSADDSAALLRRARVAVFGSTMPPVFTDQEGRFEIAAPVSGFTVRVSKPGFAPVYIPASDVIESRPLDVRLPRGAAIQGRVLDASGAAVVDARVTVRLGEPVSRSRIAVSVTTRTDDLGEFRVGSLAAGRYTVAIEGPNNRAGVGDSVRSGLSNVLPAPGVAAESTSGAAPVAVLLRTGEEAALTVVHDLRSAEVLSATAYAAGYDKAISELAMRTALDGARIGGRVVLPSRGTAHVSGRVLDPQGRPVAAAIVHLNPMSSGVAHTAASDLAGRYQFAFIPQGSYRIAAEKRGYFAAEYGQERAGQPGRVLVVRDRQRADRVDIGLRGGAWITGTVTDEDGEPLEGLAMHAWRVQYRNGLPVTESTGVVRRTDDRGRYRLHSLPAGTYYVVAADDPSASESAPSVMRAPKAFYPGTSTVALATPVHLDVALDASGIDMAFAQPRTVSVTGTATDAMGNPLNRPVVLFGSTRSGFPAPAPQAAAMRGGTFEFPYVTPGEYVIQAMQYWGDVPGARAPTEFTTQLISVGETDVTNIALRTLPGTTVTGRIVRENGGRPGVTGNWLSVVAADPDYEPASIFPRPWTTVINQDLTFRITGLNGPLRVTSTARLAPDVYLKAAHMGGINVAEQPVLFGRRDDTNTFIDIVLGADGAEVTGRVVNGRKEPVVSFVVAVFPVDAAHRYGGSRHMRLAYPDEQGQFRTGMLPPGDYWVAAVEALEETALHDPEVVQRLAAARP